MPSPLFNCHLQGQCPEAPQLWANASSHWQADPGTGVEASCPVAAWQSNRVYAPFSWQRRLVSPLCPEFAFESVAGWEAL